MIGGFQTILEEELFYSACARCDAVMQFPATGDTPAMLFGSRHASVAVDLPTRLGVFAERLPPGSIFSADYLVRRHTLAPYYLPFMPAARADALLHEMHTGGAGDASRLLGLSACTVPLPSHLRFCARCVRSDHAQYGVAAWRRVHQLPGVLVCPEHGVPLFETSVRRIERLASRRLTELSDEVMANATPVPVPLGSGKVARALARDSLWLLTTVVAPVGLEWLHGRYRQGLVAAGLTNPAHRKMPISPITEAFVAHYGREWLEAVGCPVVLGPNNESWLSRLLRKPRSAMHPLQHLLVINFLGVSAADFLSIEPGWPALARDVVRGRKRRRTLHGSGAEPVADGVGPAADVAWHERIKVLAADETVSLRDAAHSLGISPQLFKLHARSLGVWRARWRAEGARDVCPAPGATAASRLEAYRQEWLELRRRFPSASRMELERRAPSAVKALKRYDANWLAAHQPPKAPTPRSVGSHVDWAARDDEMAREVREGAERLRSAPGKPSRVTLFAIARGTSNPELVLRRSHRARLPKLAQALKDVLESREAAARRRLAWAAEEFVLDRRLASPGELLFRAGAHGKVLKPLLMAEAERLSGWLSDRVPRAD